MKLLLASASPRRRELLIKLGVSFEIVPSAFEETAEGLSAYDTAKRFAEGKAKEVYGRYADCFVLGADTVVSLDGRIFGKPESEADAACMLRRLSGKTHSVYTGVCLIGKDFFASGVAETKVSFYPLEERTISQYVASGLPMDKAGAYGIQDDFPLVKGYEGSYTNVVGLPTERVRALFKEAGIC